MSSVDQGIGQSAIARPVEDERLFPTSLLKRRSALSGTSRPLLIVVSIISAVLVPSRMLLSSGPPDDSSVFAYVGWAMKHGLMPYRDIWDHKGPLLYYLNFVGMSLSPNSTFGIGLLELAAYSIFFFLIYRMISSFASRFVVLAIAALSVGFVAHFAEGGNMTESWALLPLATAHYACWRWSQQNTLRWCAPVIGACFVCIFALRANMVTFPIVAMLVLLYATNRTAGLHSAIKQLALALAAALAVAAAIVAPLYHWGALHDFVAAYFGYNAAYSGALSLGARYLHTTNLLIFLFGTAIAILGIAGWALGLKESTRPAEFVAGLPSWYLRTLLWSLPLEVAGASMSGRDYPHYLLPLFPTFSLLAAWFLSELEEQTKAVPAKPALLMVLWIGLLPSTLTTYAGNVSESMISPRSDHIAVAQFIQRATTPRDRITVVGGDSSAYITLLAQRLPASRFVYQYALIDANNPIAGEQRKQFVCDIAQNRPAVIISGDPLLGILCATELECTLRNLNAPANDYGYQSKLLPKLLQNVIASEYRPVSDSRFGSMRVLVRKDLAIPAQW